MDAPRLVARYCPAARTLEFDLSEAPLVDAVEDVVVLSISGMPCAAPGQRGLFYGKDTFLFEQPFLFDSAAIELMCWLRLREHSASALRASAAEQLRTPALNGRQCGGRRARQTESVVALSATVPGAQYSPSYLYFATSPPPDSSRGIICPVDAAAAFSLRPGGSVGYRPLTTSLFFCSAAALCFEL